MNRHKFSKMITNSLMLLVFGYVLIAIFSRSFLDTTYQGFNPVNLFYILIIGAFIGMAWASYNFSFDNKRPWEHGKLISITLLISSILLAIGVILFSIEEILKNDPIHLFASSLMIGAYITLTGYGYLFYSQLMILHKEKLIIKKPSYYQLGAFSSYALAYLMFTIGFAIGSISTILNIIGIIFGAIGTLLIIIGAVKISVPFKVYAYLVENEDFREH